MAFELLPFGRYRLIGLLGEGGMVRVHRARLAPAALGRVDFNPEPWSNVVVDGTAIKNTPVLRHPLPAGPHTAVFGCGSCDPALRQEPAFTVKAGARSEQIVRFEGT